MQSKIRSSTTLTSREKNRRLFWNNYLKYPIYIDIALSLLTMLIIYLVGCVHTFHTVSSSNSLSDILNELISSTLSAGGFVLAAIAILASMKQNVKKLEGHERPSSGRELLFNSDGYQNIIKVYANCAFVFLFLFIYFTVLRSISETITIFYLFWGLVFGANLLVFTFLRTIYLLKTIVAIRILLNSNFL